MIPIVTAVAYLLRDLTAIAGMILFMRLVFRREVCFSAPKAALLVGLMACNACVGSFVLMGQVEDYKAIMDFAANCIDVASILLLTRPRKFWKTVLFVLIYSFTVDMFYSLLSPYIPQDLYVECLVNIVLYGGIVFLLYYAAKKEAINFLPQVLGEIPKWLYAVLLLFELTCCYKEFGISADWYNALYVVSSAGVFLTVIYLVVKIFSLAHRQNAILQQMELQKQFGEKTIVGDEELRRFRHDYRNHMIVVNAYLRSGCVDEASAYLAAISSHVDGVLNKIVTGNFVADAILNHKAVTAAEDAIALTFDGAIPGEGIANEDLCTILANLLDNAIEACRKLPATAERRIRVKGAGLNDTFLLHVENPTMLTAVPAKTTKRDSRNHGIGLRNVTRVAKSYDGSVSCNVDNGVFSADVRLCLQQKTEE